MYLHVCYTYMCFYRENQLKTVQCHLQRQLEQANKIITDKLPFIDTSEISLGIEFLHFVFSILLSEDT